MVWRILEWSSARDILIRARHIPGNLNVIADSISRRDKAIQTEWSLHPLVFQEICEVLHKPMVDLFATSLNAELPTYIFPVEGQGHKVKEDSLVRLQIELRYLNPQRNPQGKCMIQGVFFQKWAPQENQVDLTRPFIPQVADSLIISSIKPANHFTALAASLAFKGGVALDEIMASCFWRSHSTYKFLLGRFVMA